jgi:hypothetical protein
MKSLDNWAGEIVITATTEISQRPKSKTLNPPLCDDRSNSTLFARLLHKGPIHIVCVLKPAADYGPTQWRRGEGDPPGYISLAGCHRMLNCEVNQTRSIGDTELVHQAAPIGVDRFR